MQVGALCGFTVFQDPEYSPLGLTATPSKPQPRMALFLNPQYSRALFFLLATEAKARGTAILHPGRQPYNPPYMAFSLSLIYPGVISCHVPLNLTEAEILLTVLWAHATIVMHTKMLDTFLIVLLFSFCPPALLTLSNSA